MDKKIEDFNAWAETLPPPLRAIAEAYPMYECWRSTRNEGHYRIISYSTPKGQPEPVTVTIAHGSDSYLPGVATYDQPPDQLIKCGCGKWEWPSQEQIARTRAYLTENHDHDCADPRCHLSG